MKTTVIAAFVLSSIGVAHAASPDVCRAPAPERPALNIAVDSQKGASFRLIYDAGSGWKVADYSGPRLASANPQPGPTGALKPPPSETPQSVFVDGPSGYVFVYVLDEGWKFVGRVADPKR